MPGSTGGTEMLSEPIEGMPGTWSHCGLKSMDHLPHRHAVTMNEGTHHNVLCKGTPGQRMGDAPMIQPIYPKPTPIGLFGAESGALPCSRCAGVAYHFSQCTVLQSDVRRERGGP